MWKELFQKVKNNLPMGEHKVQFQGEGRQREDKPVFITATVMISVWQNNNQGRNNLRWKLEKHRREGQNKLMELSVMVIIIVRLDWFNMDKRSLFLWI